MINKSVITSKAYAWVKEGKIFLKKEDKGKAIPVTHADDLAKL